MSEFRFGLALEKKKKKKKKDFFFYNIGSQPFLAHLSFYYTNASVVRPSTIFKDLLLQNHLFGVSGSHDQDGRHAHIW